MVMIMEMRLKTVKRWTSPKVRPSLQFSQNADNIQRDKEDKENEKIFKAQVRMFIECHAMYETSKRKAFALIYEQCHNTLQAKLKAREKYATEIKGDLTAMLKAIQEHTLSYQENCYDVKIVIDLLRTLLNTKQQHDEALADFTRRFKAARDFHEAQVGTKMKIEKMAKIDEKWDNMDDQVSEQDLWRYYIWRMPTKESMVWSSRDSWTSFRLTRISIPRLLTTQ
jgi:hypothetical protein